MLGLSTPAWGLVTTVVLLVAGVASLLFFMTRGWLTLDLGWGRTLRAVGPIVSRIQAPRELVFEQISAPYLGQAPGALRGKIEVLDRSDRLVVAAHRTKLHWFESVMLESIVFEPPDRIGSRHLRDRKTCYDSLQVCGPLGVMRVASDRLDQLVVAVAKAAPDFDGDQQLLALNLYRTLAEGSPASAADVAERAGADVQRVEEVLRSWPGVYRDDRGRVVGFWGLTVTRLTPTHVLEIQGRELFTWCAWDTLFLPGILDVTARVGSTCPTGEAISLVVSPERIVETSHAAAVVSFLEPHRDADVIQSFCHFVHFFASSRAGRTWTAEHPGTFLLSLEDAFELGRRVNALNFPLELGSTR